jgi:hypothetical protein
MRRPPRCRHTLLLLLLLTAAAVMAPWLMAHRCAGLNDDVVPPLPPSFVTAAAGAGAHVGAEGSGRAEYSVVAVVRCTLA